MARARSNLTGYLIRANVRYTVATAPGRNGSSYGAALPVTPSVLSDITATMCGPEAIEAAWTLPTSLPTGAHLQVVNAQGAYGSGWIPGKFRSSDAQPAARVDRVLRPRRAGWAAPVPGLWQWAVPLVASAAPLAALTYDRTSMKPFDHGSPVVAASVTLAVVYESWAGSQTVPGTCSYTRSCRCSPDRSVGTAGNTHAARREGSGPPRVREPFRA
jgi:hypothetical protein